MLSDFGSRTAYHAVSVQYAMEGLEAYRQSQEWDDTVRVDERAVVFMLCTHAESAWQRGQGAYDLTLDNDGTERDAQLAAFCCFGEYYKAEAYRQASDLLLVAVA